MAVTSYQNIQIVLIGATSEFDNYSVGNTDDGISWLHHFANERIPELAHGKSH